MSLARHAAWINNRYGWRAPLWALVLTTLAVCLDFLPLFNVLGYDFAFVLGLVTALAAVDIGHGTVVAARRSFRQISCLRLAFESSRAAWALLVLPLLLSLANALRVRNCDLGVGLIFFLLLPVATAGFAATAGVAAGLLVPTRRWGRVVAFALPVLSLVWTLVRLYRDPAVFAYDPFGGFFPGPIYDEALRPSLRFLWYRVANLTWALALLTILTCLCDDGQASGVPEPSWSAARGFLRSGRRLALAAAMLAAALAWFGARGYLGFHITKGDLLRVLPLETRSPHFVLHSEKGGESEKDLALVRGDLEFRFAELTQILGVTPTTPITVYRFSSAASKKDIVGAANTLYAKPWTREIFVQVDRFPAQRLRHELAHVFASAFGDRCFGVALAWRWWGPLPVPKLASGLIEGLAEAADFDNPDGRATIHQEAAVMIALGQAPDLGRSLGAGFTFESGPRAYTIAGSFCRFLFDRYGVAKLRALYQSAGDYDQVYGRTLPALAADWRTFLAALPSDEGIRSQAEEQFRRPAIFQKVCARELAARVSEAHASLDRAPEEAVAILSRTCSDDPEEPTFRLGLAEALIAAGQADRALDILKQAEGAVPWTRPLRLHAANLVASIHFHAGRLDEARAAVERSLANASSDWEERMARVRLRALRDESSRQTLGRVSFGNARGRELDPGLVVYLLTEFARQNPDEALGPYLVGRQLAGRDAKLAVHHFAEACPVLDDPPAVPLDLVFYKECRRGLGESAFLAGEFDLAQAAYAWLLRTSTNEADRLRAQDFLARIAWQEGQLQIGDDEPQEDDHRE